LGPIKSQSLFCSLFHTTIIHPLDSNLQKVYDIRTI
jgi:hypothetical protein